MSKNMKRKRVVIIGCGVSGLCSIKSCIEEDLEPVCFELSTDIGGVWNYEPEPRVGKASVIKSTITNTSKENSCFSDFPMPDSYPNFMSYDLYFDYLKSYASHFDLLKYVKFNTRVDKVKKISNNEWSVTFTNITENETSTDIFDAVMVCSGNFRVPFSPDYEGLHTVFDGTVVHSWSVRNTDVFKDKNVIIIGFANTAADIAVELSRVASNVYMSFRSGSLCMSRLGRRGLPKDYITFNRRFYFDIAKLLPSFPVELSKINLKSYDAKLFGLRPPDTLANKRLVVNDELPFRISTNQIIMKPKIKSFQRSSCEFLDGTYLDNLDCVVLCTGYSLQYEFLDDGLIEFKRNRPFLYKSIFPIKHKNLAFIGCLGIKGNGIGPAIEMQARLAAAVIKGSAKLPNQHIMLQDFKASLKVVPKLTSSQYAKERKQQFLYTHLPYMDSLAALNGCKPSLWKYFFTDPKFWFKLYFGSFSPFQYRLNGRNSKYELARSLILTQDYRMLCGYPLHQNGSVATKTIGLDYDAIFTISNIFIKFWFNTLIKCYENWIYVNRV